VIVILWGRVPSHIMVYLVCGDCCKCTYSSEFKYQLYIYAWTVISRSDLDCCVYHLFEIIIYDQSMLLQFCYGVFKYLNKCYEQEIICCLFQVSFCTVICGKFTFAKNIQDCIYSSLWVNCLTKYLRDKT
jgi:hypothetical protein